MNAKSPQRPMLRHAHIDLKGGQPPFAAVCTKVCSSDKSAAHQIAPRFDQFRVLTSL